MRGRLLSLLFGTLAALLALATPMPTIAQEQLTWTPAATRPGGSSCGLFNPCGPLPFPVLAFPTVALPSPTPRAEVQAQAPTPGAGTPTLTPSPSTTPLMDIGAISTLAGLSGELAGTLSAQGTAVLLVGGTPVGVTDMAEMFGANVGGPFALIRAVQEAAGGLGLIGAFLNFGLLAVAFSAFVRLSTLIAPAILSIVRLILNFIQAIKPF